MSLFSRAFSRHPFVVLLATNVLNTFVEVFFLEKATTKLCSLICSKQKLPLLPGAENKRFCQTKNPQIEFCNKPICGFKNY